MAYVELLQKSDVEKYDLFLQNNPDSYIFHTNEWKNVLEQSFNIQPYYIIVKDREEDIRGVLPLFYVKNSFGKKLVSLPFSIYGGILVDFGYDKPLISKAIDLKQKLDCDCIEIRQPPNTKHDFILEKNSMHKVEIRVDQQILLDSSNSLLNGGKSCRNSLKRAEKHNINVKQLDDINLLERIYRLELITKKRLGVIPPGINYFYNLWKYLHPKEYIEILYSESDEELLSYDIFLKYKDRVLGIHNGTNIKGRKTGANHLMIWTAIKQSYQDGFKIFDLGSTPDVTKDKVSSDFKGLFEFKNSFGTTNIPYSYFYYPQNVGINKEEVLQKKSLSMRVEMKILQKTPIFIIKKIAPYLIKKYLL